MRNFSSTFKFKHIGMFLSKVEIFSLLIYNLYTGNSLFSSYGKK